VSDEQIARVVEATMRRLASPDREASRDATATALQEEKWGGEWMSHTVAAWILQYPSRHTGGIACGNTLRKAILAAPADNPLAVLRDTHRMRAKHPETGLLRTEAVEHVARLRHVDVQEVREKAVNRPAAPRALRKRGNPRPEPARTGE
jgi:hypothetical protein